MKNENANNKFKNYNKMCFFKNINCMMKMLLFTIIPSIILSYRYEPFSIWKSRYLFNEKNFYENNINDTLKLSYNHKAGFYCKAKNNIEKGNTIFKIPSNQIISLFDNYPFKHSFYSLLNELEFEGVGFLNKNITNNFLLSLRILFELKVNHTESFVQLKKIENNLNNQKNNHSNTLESNDKEDFITQESNFTKYKSYLRYKNSNDFLYKYLGMMPLQYMYSQTAFYPKGDEDYSKSGHIKPIGSLIEQIYLTLADKIENFENDLVSYKNRNDTETNLANSSINDESDDQLQVNNDLNEELIATFKKYTDLFRVVRNWFNKDNLNYFKSVYAFVSSRSFKHSLTGYIGISELHNNANDELNIILDKDTNGVPYLIPSIDLCNHYHPTSKDIEIEDGIKKAKLKKIIIEKNDKHYIIKALSEYKKNEEFNFSYTSILSNDYLLLNYGFIIPNNPFQEFIFNFRLIDEGKKLFEELHKAGFNMGLVSLVKTKIDSNEEISEDSTNSTNSKSESPLLSIDFHLTYDKINQDLLDFITIYLSSNHLLYEEISNKSKVNNEIKNTMKILIVYYRVIEKNIRDIFESKLSIKAHNSTFLLNEIYNNTKEIDDLQNKLDVIDNKEEIKEVYSSMDYLIKSTNILSFHSENIKILESHQNKILKKILSIYSDFIFGYSNHIKENSNSRNIMENLKMKYLLGK